MPEDEYACWGCRLLSDMMSCIASEMISPLETSGFRYCWCGHSLHL